MPQALIERCTNQVPVGRQTNRTPVRWQRNQAPAGRQMLQNELYPLQLSSTTIKKSLTDQANFDKLVKLPTRRDEHVKGAAADVTKLNRSRAYGTPKQSSSVATILDQSGPRNATYTIASPRTDISIPCIDNKEKCSWPVSRMAKSSVGHSEISTS
ncbi:unnamed protein product [Gongylonema pulchrum]|uniref:Uncharacterized protein n=1 Tax=Gongylonema pulchrum TaxID=637853 RepID=A0A183E0I4_9BILA|nr:unnamed protein product [Gongylonema pulchrum]